MSRTSACAAAARRPVSVLAAALVIAGASLFLVPATRAAAQGACVANATTLCLNGSRFKVQVNWSVFPITESLQVSFSANLLPH